VSQERFERLREELSNDFHANLTIQPPPNLAKTSWLIVIFGEAVAKILVIHIVTGHTRLREVAPVNALKLRPSVKISSPKMTMTHRVLAATGWQINTAFIERANLAIRQHVAAVGRRVITLCKGETGVCQQLALYHVYHNFCLPHASLRLPLA
jgi:IS1 family transposase